MLAAANSLKEPVLPKAAHCTDARFLRMRYYEWRLLPGPLTQNLREVTEWPKVLRYPRE